MPHYQVYHSCEVSPEQHQVFATAVTNLHCRLFSAPSLFVNITFHPAPTPTYVGGHAHVTNYIHAHLRPRGPASAQKLTNLVEQLMALWEQHIHRGGQGRLNDPRALHNIFIFDDIAAGAEQGFVLPEAGQDAKWVEERMGDFEARAREGDEGMKRLIQEIRDGV